MARGRKIVLFFQVEACEDTYHTGYLLGLTRVYGFDDAVGHRGMQHSYDERTARAHVVSIFDASHRLIISVEPGHRLSDIFVGHALPSFLRIVLSLC